MIEHFHRPHSLREALVMKRKLRDAAFLAGGTYINSGDFELAPAQVIALDGLGLDRIEAKDGTLRIGACVTLQRLLEDRRVGAPLKAAIAQVAPRNIRNAATLGGHVAARLPQSDILPMLVALEARLVISGAGAAKTVDVAAYVTRPVPGLITRIEVPRPAASRVAGCRNLRESANARSILSVAASATLSRGVVRDPIVAVSGLGRCVVHVTAVEHALDGHPLPGTDAIQALVSAAVRPAAAPGGSVALRRYEAGSLVALCLRDLVAAKGGRP
jgi:probable selenate reductase FAD-binding subunit